MDAVLAEPEVTRSEKKATWVQFTGLGTEGNPRI